MASESYVARVPELNRTATTYRYERWRALSAGVIESAGTTFLLLIAVRSLHAGPVAKAMVAAGGSVGLLLSPFFVSFVQSRGWATAQAASRFSFIGMFAFLLPTLFPTLPMFIFGGVVGLAMSAVSIPLLTQIYQENYPEQERGRLFSRTMMLRIGATALFSDVIGNAFAGRMEHFRWLLLAFAGAFALSSFCFRRIPSRPLTAAGGTHPLRALRFAREDRLFRLTLISWMFLGFGTLLMVPLRVEFLANTSKYGITLYGQPLDEAMIAVLTAVIPNVVRLVLSPVWGWLFDRVNFFALRVALNIGFALGVVTFFMSNSLSGLIVGAVIFGISNAGGDVAWSLWVTKFAPPARVADYMSVHVCFTGLRGVLAPFIAFYLVAHHFPIQTLGWISAGLICCAILLLLPELKSDQKPRRASALVEEISE
ncbi:MAG: Major Facilitator Superfamily protein [Verrucomicrobiales bacterium]|nr:Major Facilitator Superfamily protein [Verrucomicrobiales bacterium]